MGKGKLFYGYYMVAAGFTLHVIGFIIYGSYGVFFAPLLDEFGWTRAAISGALSLFMIMWGFFCIIVGSLNDRFGPQLTLTSCGLIWGLGCFLLSRVTAIWQLYLYYGVLVSLGMSSVDVLPLTTTARWFVKRRGMMTGIVKGGAGLGIMVAPLLANWLISGYGWRLAFLALGVIAVVFSVAIAQVLKRDPAKMGLLPYGQEAPPEIGKTESEGLSLRPALCTRRFWMLCVVYLVIAFCCDAILIHIVQYTRDMGFSAASAAGVLSTLGGASIAGRFLCGTACDKAGVKRMILACFALLIIAFIWLLMSRELWMLYLFALVDGFAHGGLFTLISPWVANLFGLKAHGAILGTASFIGYAGGALGPLFFGFVFDVTGSYRLALTVGTVLCVSAIILSLFIRPIAKAKPVA